MLLYLLDSPFLPGPHLGRDVIVRTYAAAMRISGKLKVEARIVHEHKHVRTESVKQTLGLLQVAENARQPPQHLAESHHVHLVVMQIGLAPRGLGHEVASEKADLRSRIQFAD